MFTIIKSKAVEYKNDMRLREFILKYCEYHLEAFKGWSLRSEFGPYEEKKMVSHSLLCQIEQWVLGTHTGKQLS